MIIMILTMIMPIKYTTSNFKLTKITKNSKLPKFNTLKMI